MDIEVMTRTFLEIYIYKRMYKIHLLLDEKTRLIFGRLMNFVMKSFFQSYSQRGLTLELASRSSKRDGEWERCRWSCDSSYMLISEIRKACEKNKPNDDFCCCDAEKSTSLRCCYDWEGMENNRISITSFLKRIYSRCEPNKKAKTSATWW